MPEFCNEMAGVGSPYGLCDYTSLSVGMSSDYFEMMQKMFSPPFNLFFSMLITEDKMREDSTAWHTSTQ